ncbi:MAG: DUF5946 family protein [Chloroflexota bacterium]
MSDSVCPQCGAAPRAGQTCQELLHDILEKKYAADAAEYGIAVACYALQHPAQQTDRTLEWAHFHLTVAVEAGLSLEEIRRLARARFDQRRYRAPPGSLRTALARAAWQMNIRDLDALAGGTDAGRILHWARTVLEDIGGKARDQPIGSRRQGRSR